MQGVGAIDEFDALLVAVVYRPDANPFFQRLFQRPATASMVPNTSRRGRPAAGRRVNSTILPRYGCIIWSIMSAIPSAVSVVVAMAVLLFVVASSVQSREKSPVFACKTRDERREKLFVRLAVRSDRSAKIRETGTRANCLGGERLATERRGGPPRERSPSAADLCGGWADRGCQRRFGHYKSEEAAPPTNRTTSNRLPTNRSTCGNSQRRLNATPSITARAA